MKYLLLSLILLSGCSAFKADVGDYVTEAVIQKIETDLKAKLPPGVTIAEIKSALQDNQGKTDIFGSAKDFAKDFTLIEAQKLVNSKMQELQSQVATKNDLESKSKEAWYTLLIAVCGLISTYLGKQIASARGNHKRDLRISLVEQALGINDPSDSNGTKDAIASTATPGTPSQT